MLLFPTDLSICIMEQMFHIRTKKMKNKNHWYDGRFMMFYCSNQDSLFKEINSLISEKSTIVDVGCGTGRFSFSIAEKCIFVLGIDLSIRNINKAQQISTKILSAIFLFSTSLNVLYKRASFRLCCNYICYS